MDTNGFIQALRADGAAFATAARDRLGAHVPSCPEWNMSELVWHTGRIHRHRIWLIEERPDGPQGFDIDRPDDADLVDWFEQGTNELADLLARSDQSSPVWTWFPADQTVAFWTRRMAQETTVHRWDAQLAAGAPQPIDAPMAADGIDEMFAVFMSLTEEPLKGNGETIHVHATDADADWLVRLEGDHPTFERGHHKGDAGTRGSASDLLLLLWRRARPEDVETFGDRAVLDRFLGWADLT